MKMWLKSFVDTTALSSRGILIGIIAYSYCSSPTLAEGRLVILPESAIEIVGSATLTKWRCRSTQVSGVIEAGRAIPQRAFLSVLQTIHDEVTRRSLTDRINEVRPRAEIKVIVDSFSCGGKGIDTDMRNALKSKEHPSIVFTFSTLDSIKFMGVGMAEVGLITTGALTVAGHREEVKIPFSVAPEPDDSYRLQGKKDFRMTTFGVTPPTALLGLIKVRDDISITFDVAFGHPR